MLALMVLLVDGQCGKQRKEKVMVDWDLPEICLRPAWIGCWRNYTFGRFVDIFSYLIWRKALQIWHYCSNSNFLLYAWRNFHRWNAWAQPPQWQPFLYFIAAVLTRWHHSSTRFDINILCLSAIGRLCSWTATLTQAPTGYFLQDLVAWLY